MFEVAGAWQRRRWCGCAVGADSRQSRGGRRPEGDIYRDAETPRAGPTLSHMLIGYLRRIFLDVTVHATPMPSGRARNFRPINIDTYVTGLDTSRLTQGQSESTRCFCNMREINLMRQRKCFHKDPALFWLYAFRYSAVLSGTRFIQLLLYLFSVHKS